ncbi:MAG TPA: response regulator transcription factor [Bacteroidetes bacterium]|nr:response regulator transcription factor [Bacteroidota bacterium]
MSKPRIFILEDEALIADHIAICLEDLGYEIAGIADNGEEALNAIEKQNPDLCLIDINLHGDLDGIDVAQEIRRRFSVPFVFVTSSADRRTLARVQRTEPAGFIVKPYTSEDLASNIGIALYKASQKAVQPISSSEVAPELDDSFFVKDKHELIRIRYRDILYAEAMDNYTRLHTQKGKFVLSQTLKSVDARLNGQGFLRVHRSFIVNLLHVDLIAPRHLLIGDLEIPVSESQRARLMELIRLF